MFWKPCSFTHIEIQMIQAGLQEQSKEQLMWKHVHSTPELTIDGTASPSTRPVDEGRVVVQCGIPEGLPRIPLLPMEGQG